MFDKHNKRLASIYKHILQENTSSDPEPPRDISAREVIAMKREVTDISINLIRRINTPDHRGVRSEWNVHGNILKRLKVNVLTPKDPKFKELSTMAVDNAGNLYINYDFYNQLKVDAVENGLNEVDYIEGVFMHEAFHVYNETFARRGDRNPGLWNVATDYVMNRDLLKGPFKLPPLGLIPEKRGDEWWINVDLRGIEHAANRGGQILDLDLEDTNLEFDITNSTCEQVHAQFEDKFKDIPPELAEQIQKILEEMGEEMDTHPSDEDGEPSDEEGPPEETPLEKIAKEAVTEAEENDQEVPDRDNEEERAPPPPGGEPDTGTGDQQGQLGQGEIEISKLDQICSQYVWNDILKGYLAGSLKDRGDPITNIKRNASTYDDMILGMRKGGRFKTLPPGLKKTTTYQSGEGDTLHGVFCLDTSGSMWSIMEAVRYGLACMAKQLKSKLKIALVHQEKHVDVPSFIELNGSDTIKTLIDQMNIAWRGTKTGGAGPDFMEAVKYFAENFRGSSKYKHFFIVTDGYWTDHENSGSTNDGKVKWSNNQEYWNIASQFIQQITPGRIRNDGLCILRAIKYTSNEHPMVDQDLGLNSLDPGFGANIIKMINYLDINFNTEGL